ncbi:MAG TPA: NAD-dependent epimerase/dehydratase family protein [Solirubrobacteraceae bacterium]|nr:NAD-dependent epimerase/dehydratase family protein [Solirubrobacteraceae bacterium]
MRLLVTGSAGFIGAALTARLARDGHAVAGLDLAGGVDLRTDPLEPHVDGADAVLHLAARTGVRGAAPAAAYRDSNVHATARLIAAAARAGVGRVLLASSSSVYAPALGATPEDAPLAPRSAYGQTKLEAEALCRASALDVVIVRFFTVYGPGQRPDMAFARLIAAGLGGGRAPLLGDGRHVRDFTYVDDAVEGAVLALGRGRPGATYNVSGGRPVALQEAIEVLGAVMGRPVAVDRRRAHAADVARTHASLTRARAELGYAPVVGLRDGLARQIGAARLAHAA